jgi:hypothetical protein
LAWIETLHTLADDYPDYSFVPGHGDIGNAEDIDAFREYLSTLRALVADAQARGQSGAALTQTVLDSLRVRYGHWEGFDAIGTANIVDVEAELNGKKRVPLARTDITK